MVWALFGLGPTELLLGLVCLGFVAAGIALAVFLTTRATPKDNRWSALESENERLRLELENQQLRDEIERRKGTSD